GSALACANPPHPSIGLNPLRQPSIFSVGRSRERMIRMATRELLIVGGGLFGSQAADYARLRGLDATVFDSGLKGAASHAAAELFKEEWAGKKLEEHFQQALVVL